MLDILVSEILVLLLLVFPLVRPFSKRLKQISAISIFPFFALLLTACIIWGQGISFSLLPIILVVIIAIITEFTRFAMLLRQLPNQFYTIPSILWRIILLIIVAGSFVFSFYFSPEREVPCCKLDVSSEELLVDINSENIIVGKHFSSSKENNQLVQVLVLSPFQSAGKNGNSITRYLVNEGFSVTELNNIFETNILNIKRWNEFYSVFKSIKNNFYSKPKIEEPVNSAKFNLILTETIKAIKQKTKSDPLIYIFAEGKYNGALYNFSIENPNSFAGIFFAVGEEKLLEFEKKINNRKENSFFILDERDGLKFSNQISQVPYCMLIEEKKKLSDFGDLRGNDIFAAYLLGATRDLGRYDRIALAQSFEKWLKLK